jgi:hypothetical protein
LSLPVVPLWKVTSESCAAETERTWFEGSATPFSAQYPLPLVSS